MTQAGVITAINTYLMLSKDEDEYSYKGVCSKCGHIHWAIKKGTYRCLNRKCEGKYTVKVKK